MTLLFLSIDELKMRLRSGKITISVHGLGKLGLPLAVIYANAGARVIGVDRSQEIVDALNQGKILDSTEPHIHELVESLVHQQKLKATMNGVEAARKSDISVIVVPTLVDERLRPNLSFLKLAAIDIGQGLRKGDVVLLESTVPPGTTENFLRPVLEDVSGLTVSRDFGLGYSPERVYVGRIISDVVDRYPKLVGGIDKKSEEVIAAIYEVIARKGVIRLGSTRAAEITKVFEGIYRDVNIALANEMAWICEKLNVDVYRVIRAANTQPFCNILQPGIGVGGHCIPVYPHFLTDVIESLNHKPSLIQTARKINLRAPLHTTELVLAELKAAGKPLKNTKVTVLGLSYRAGVKEDRFSPVYPLVEALKEHGLVVVVHDPLWSRNEADRFPFDFTDDLEEALSGADCIIIATEHRQYQEETLLPLFENVNKPIILIDGRRMLDKTQVMNIKDMRYVAIGDISVPNG
ncbi:MAG: nucleotide sugar dehydrogenase [Candidatus Heimdallarchaeota archaeon]